jgi:flagellar biosynthesis activator protein FlaF
VNALDLARSAYAMPGQPLRSDRATEYDLFAQVTRRLRDTACQTGVARARAIHDNVELWTALAADVAGDGNALPRDLRARLFWLAEFTLAHSRKVLKGEAEVAVLVDINTAIMRGLAPQGGAA